jgi:hypothetical protein
VVDGSVLRKKFDVYHELPAPESELGQDLVWEKAQRHMHGTIVGMCVRLSECRLENPEATKARARGGTWLFMHEIRQQVIESYRGHHQYDWVRPRRTWQDATCPVYIDLGGDFRRRALTVGPHAVLVRWRTLNSMRRASCVSGKARVRHARQSCRLYLIRLDGVK